MAAMALMVVVLPERPARARAELGRRVRLKRAGPAAVVVEERLEPLLA